MELGERKLLRKTVSGIMLFLLLVSTLTLAFNIQTAKAEGTIYIRADGSVDPPTAPIQPDTEFYTFNTIDWWPKFSHDLRNTGYSTSRAPKTNQTLWIYQIGAVMYCGPAVVDNMVFIGSENGRVYALNATTGEQIWNFTAGGYVRVTPAVADGMVFVASRDGNVYSLNQTTGEKMWNCTLSGINNSQSSPTVTDGMVFIGGSAFYALNETTGELIWQYEVYLNTVRSSPAVANGKVFVVVQLYGAPTVMVALNETTGEQIWNYTLSTSALSSPSPAVANGVVFVGGAYPNKVYALNETNGVEIWSSEIAGPVVMSSPAVADGMVFMGTYGQYPWISMVYAINQTNGNILWVSGPHKYRFGASSPAVAGGVVVVGSGDGLAGGLYAFSEKTGAMLWSYESGCHFYNPAIANGTIFAGSTSGKVYAFYSPPIHDVSVINVKQSQTTAKPGDVININVTVENQGDYAEIFNVTAYVNTTQIGKKTVANLGPGANRLLSFTWDTAGFDLGNYTISAIADVVTNETDTLDNAYIDGIITVRLPIYDIAVTDVTPSKTVVGQGYCMSVNVTIENPGEFTENFNATLYANTTEISTFSNITLTSGNSTTLTFTWNTTDFVKGNYTISAYAWPVPGETHTADNTLVDGTVIVTIPGDVVEPYFEVDIYDVTAICICYDSKIGPPRDPMYYPNCDIDGNGIIDIYDVTAACITYGQKYP